MVLLLLLSFVCFLKLIYSRRFHFLSQAVSWLTFSTGQLLAGEFSFSLAPACCLHQHFPSVDSSALISLLCLSYIETISVHVKRRKLLGINPTLQKENQILQFSISLKTFPEATSIQDQETITMLWCTYTPSCTPHSGEGGATNKSTNKSFLQ